MALIHPDLRASPHAPNHRSLKSVFKIAIIREFRLNDRFDLPGGIGSRLDSLASRCASCTVHHNEFEARDLGPPELRRPSFSRYSCSNLVLDAVCQFPSLSVQRYMNI